MIASAREGNPPGRDVAVLGTQCEATGLGLATGGSVIDCGGSDPGIIHVELPRGWPARAHTLARWLALITVHGMTCGKRHANDHHLWLHLRGAFPSGQPVIVSAEYHERAETEQARLIHTSIQRPRPETLVGRLAAIDDRRVDPRYPITVISFGWRYLDGAPPPEAEHIEDIRDRVHDPSADKEILALDGTHPHVLRVVLNTVGAVTVLRELFVHAVSLPADRPRRIRRAAPPVATDRARLDRAGCRRPTRHRASRGGRPPPPPSGLRERRQQHRTSLRRHHTACADGASGGQALLTNVANNRSFRH